MIDLIISAVLKGGMYILISMGLSLVYGVMKIPNFAHGEFYLIGRIVHMWGFPCWDFLVLLSSFWQQ